MLAQLSTIFPGLGPDYFENNWAINFFIHARLKYTTQGWEEGRREENGPGVLNPDPAEPTPLGSETDTPSPRTEASPSPPPRSRPSRSRRPKSRKIRVEDE